MQERIARNTKRLTSANILRIWKKSKTNFKRLSLITVLHTLSRFMKESDLFLISKTHACVMFLSILKYNIVDRLLASGKVSPCVGLRCWRELVHSTFPTYVSATFIWNNSFCFVEPPPHSHQNLLHDLKNKLVFAHITLREGISKPNYCCCSNVAICEWLFGRFRSHFQAYKTFVQLMRNLITF